MYDDLCGTRRIDQLTRVAGREESIRFLPVPVRDLALLLLFGGEVLLDRLLVLVLCLNTPPPAW